MALDIAWLPESMPFLAEVLKDSDERHTPFALRALERINTPASRTVLWNAMHAKPGQSQ